MKFVEKAPIRLVDTKDMPKSDWLDWRRKGVTGTDVAAIFGMSQYKSPYQCYQDKLGLLPEIEDNNRMRFGRDFEDTVAKWFAEDNGFKVENRYAIYQSAAFPWMLANIDRWIVGERAILECKTATYMFQKEKWGPSGSDEVPDEHLFQVYHYMIVFGVRTAHLAVVFTDTKEARYYKFELNEDLAEQIIDGTKDFWENNVLAKVEPDLETMEDVISKYPADTKAALVADDDAKALCIQHEIQRQKKKECEDVMEDLKVEIGKVLGEHKELLVDKDGKALAAFSTAKPRRMVKASTLKQLSPDIYDEVSYLTDPKRSVGLKWQTLKHMVDQDD